MNRTIVLGAGFVLCAASLLWLQRVFDSSDHEKAVRLVKHLQPPSTAETFETFLHRRNGNGGEWRSVIVGGCRGIVRVSVTYPGNPPRLLAWDVEIPSQAVHPTKESPEGENALHQFTDEENAAAPLRSPSLDGGGHDEHLEGSP